MASYSDPPWHFRGRWQLTFMRPQKVALCQSCSPFWLEKDSCTLLQGAVPAAACEGS